MLQTAGPGMQSDIDKAFFSQVYSAVFLYYFHCSKIQVS